MEELEHNLKGISKINTGFNQLDIVDNNDRDKVLCSHCQRTSSNGKRCIGACVADNEY